MNMCDKLPLYLYNEMTDTERKEFETHLHECAECKKTIELFSQVRNSIRITSAPTSTINEIFEKTSRKKSFSFAAKLRSWQFSAALAACMLIGVLTFSLKPFSSELNDVYYYSDASIEEIENIDYYLDEMESDNYFFV